MMASSGSSDLLRAQVELRNLAYSYLRSMALQCAVELGIPDAVHRHGGAASLSDLLATVTVPEHRRPFLPRLLRFLAATGILAAGEGEGEYRYSLTRLSRLLVDDPLVNGGTSMAPIVRSATNNNYVAATMHLSEWFKGEDDDQADTTTPFKLANGVDLWEATRRDPRFNEVFGAGMAAETQLLLDSLVANCGDVFDGVGSLVDVGGGTGGVARAIARAFPHVKCSVLDLPNVIGGIRPAEDGVAVEYVAGDMMSSIPPADAVLLKHVLHDWSDEDCVRILTRCKKAISSSSGGGKVIIIETDTGSPSKDRDMKLEAGLAALDLVMMALTSGKERGKHDMDKVFKDAGFRHHKTRPVPGCCLSIIELFP